MSFSPRFCSLSHNVPAALRSWGGNRTQFGLSLTVIGHTNVRVITLPPNFAKPLVARWHLFIVSEFIFS